MRHVTVAVIITALAGCTSSTTTGVEGTAQTNQSVTQRELARVEMRIGESITIDDLRLTFRSVEGDSRCPIDAVCVWAGDAEIALKIEQGTQTATAALHTTLEPKKTVWNGYTIAFAGLTPAPTASKPVNVADYRARIVVTR